MTNALMSRGYLCNPMHMIPTPLPPPVIMTIQDDKPDVTGATVTKTRKPKIKAASTDKPNLRGAVVEAPTPTVKPPSVIKAKTDAPTIRRAKKD